jgi:hypothetical protein
MPRLWASGEALLWWLRPATVGGGRVSAGLADAEGSLGVQGTGFLLADGEAPPAASGDAATELWGAEANLVGCLVNRPRFGLDLLGGFRYLSLDEDLAVSHGNGTESFRTRNQFWGGQVGSQIEVRWGRVFTHLVGKAAVGSVHEVAEVRGEPASPRAASPPARAGSLTGAAGRLTHDDVAVVPEVNLNVGYQLTGAIRLYAGCSFLYLSESMRPGDAAGTALNSGSGPGSLLLGTPGAGYPFSPAGRTDCWAQGLNFGLAFRY